MKYTDPIVSRLHQFVPHYLEDGRWTKYDGPMVKGSYSISHRYEFFTPIEKFDGTVEIFSDPDIAYSHGLYHLKNIKFIDLHSDADKKFHGDGDYFIIWAGHKNILHLLIDGIGQYLYIKQRIPNLKPLPVLLRTDSGQPDVLPILKEVLGLIDLTMDDLIYIEDYKELYVENLHFITTDENCFLYGTIGQEETNRLHNGSPLTFSEHYALKTISAVKQVVDQKFNTKSDKYPKKIFLDVPEIKLDKMRNTSDWGTHLETYLEQKEYDLVREHFIEMGFKFINPWQMTLEEQILHVKNAEIVATIGSSNALHSAWCDDTKFIYFDPHRFHFLVFSRLVSSYIKNGILLNWTLEDVYEQSEIGYSGEYRSKRFNWVFNKLKSLDYDSLL